MVKPRMLVIVRRQYTLVIFESDYGVCHTPTTPITEILLLMTLTQISIVGKRLTTGWAGEVPAPRGTRSRRSTRPSAKSNDDSIIICNP